ncbi:MAG: membrane protein insertion efficiency factor YidD [Rhodospirillales bacterium]|nr:membrane protein insertion efficiency factor YidD [Rhodospirillales bacterium]
MQSLVRVYQLVVSPLIPGTCRHWPSCSEYAHQAIGMHGPAQGAWLTLKRLLRCRPFGSWGYDPVPGSEELAPRAGIGERVNHG